MSQRRCLRAQKQLKVFLIINLRRTRIIARIIIILQVPIWLYIIYKHLYASFVTYDMTRVFIREFNARVSQENEMKTNRGAGFGCYYCYVQPCFEFLTIVIFFGYRRFRYPLPKNHNGIDISKAIPFVHELIALRFFPILFTYPGLGSYWSRSVNVLIFRCHPDTKLQHV